MTLEELIDVAGTAEWRRQKAEQYPGDNRNTEAAELLDTVAKDFAALDGSDVHRRIESAYLADDTAAINATEIVSEELRSVGFHSWPKSGRELLEGIAFSFGEVSQREALVSTGASPSMPRAGLPHDGEPAPDHGAASKSMAPEVSRSSM
jgi:hypothetical protein